MKALGRFSKKYYLKQVIIYIQVYLLVVLGPLCSSPVKATPSNPNVVLGSTEPITTGNTTTVNLITEKAVINWQGLNTANGQQLIFDKSGASGAYFAVLNRVTSGGATQFNGALNGHGGHVIIVNPNGVVFGSTAVINAFKFTASGLGINSTDYTNWYNSSGQLKFTSGSGALTNNGAITAQQVNLIGKSVTNNGTIRTTSPDGLVVMAAGDKVYLAESGSSVVVDTGGSPADNVVTNTGTIDAANGGILLAAGDIFSQAAITGAQSFVAQADRNININGALNIQGDISLYADADHTLPGDFHSTAPITAGGNIEVKGNDILFEKSVFAGGNLTIKGRDCYDNPEYPWGNVTAMKTLTAGGNIEISVTGEETEWVDGHWEGRTWIDGHWEWGHCGHREWVDGHWEGGWYVPGYWDISYAPGTIFLHDDVTAGGNLMLCNNTETYNDTGNGVTLQAGKNVILAEDSIENSRKDNATYLHGRNNLEIIARDGVITNDSSLFDNPDATPSAPGAALTTISVEGSTLLMEQAPSIDTKDFTFANQGGTNLTLISNEGSVTSDMAKSQNAADEWQSIGATAFDNITLKGDGSIRSGNSGTDPAKSLWAKNGNINVDAGQSFSASKDIEAGKDISAIARQNSILLMGNAKAGQNITLTANEDVDARGNLTAIEGDVVISSSDDTTYLGGNVFAGDDILLNNNTIVNGPGTQTLEAGDNLTAEGYVRKCTEGDMYLVGNSQGESQISVDLRYNDDGPGTSTYRGNLWILGQEDIQISDDVTTFGDGCVDCEEHVFFSELPGETGGVAIISNEGKIYTRGGDDDTLNISVTGSSDAALGTGVYGFGLYTDNDGSGVLSETQGDEALAAIAIVGAEPLKIGKDGRLDASGRYYNDGSVDDRAGIGFLDVDAEIPAGVPRDPGVAFDLAIYTASRTGGVEIDCPVTITSDMIPLPIIAMTEVKEQQRVAAGAMVIDAYDIVTLGNQFKESLAAGAVGDRLEVASRITEWLDDAVGRLPFPEDLDLPENYNYVMRGAGLENKEITDGRAWVLESQFEPFVAAVAPIQEPEIKIAGCPALVSWLAGELGINKDQVQTLFVGARGSVTDIQPCDTCARMQGAARILMDSDGSRIAALAKVVNEFAAAGAPPSEEQMTLIAAAMKNPEEGTDYALASEWLDAMTQYVSILNTELGLTEEDAAATAGKYTSPVTTSDDTALAAYVSVRLSDIGG